MTAVDVVYTWVDGADPRHRAKRARYRRASDETPERWRDNGELKYSLRSLHQYAPWIRRIFIVTDDQVPDWLDTTHPKLEIIDHTAIIPDRRALPTFNSCVIEAFLHRIPGLSEHYLYFNDDMYLGQPVSLGDFLTESGQQILHADPEPQPLPSLRHWASGRLDRHARLLAYSGFLLRCANGPRARAQAMPHTPQFFVKSDVDSVVRRFALALAFGSTQRFRGWRMPPLRELYVNTLLGRAGVAVEAVLQRDAYRFVMLCDNGDGAHGLIALVDQPPKFFCINDDRRKPAAQPQLAVLLDLCLKRLFPHPSPFERGAAGR